MPNYRLPELSLSTRIELALEMIKPIPEREWGWVTKMAEKLGVSRKFLYDLQTQGLESLAEGLLPQKTGPKTEPSSLEIDKEFIQRSIAILPMLKGSVRDIQHGLRILFGVDRSVGYISETLQAAGERAKQHNQGIRLPVPILGEADEIFQGRKPCLTVVDGRSFMVVNLTPADSYDKTSWGVTYLELIERGVEFHDLACDGGKGLRAGIKEAELSIPLRPDLFHLLRDAQKLTKRLENAAYRAIRTTERAYQAALEELGLISRPGRPLKVETTLSKAERQELICIETFDNWSYLLGEVRSALEPITADHILASAAEAEATLETAVALLKEFSHADIIDFAEDLEKRIDELIAPLAWLEQRLRPLLKTIDKKTRAFILWAWQHRQELEDKITAILPTCFSSQALAIWKLLGLFHRSSSLAESFHSWLRPYLQIHRGMPNWLFPLLQLFWNHHTFQRGKREGSSPLELAGISDAPSLAKAVDQLFGPIPTPQPV